MAYMQCGCCINRGNEVHKTQTLRPSKNRTNKETPEKVFTNTKAIDTVKASPEK